MAKVRRLNITCYEANVYQQNDSSNVTQSNNNLKTTTFSFLT